MKARLASLALGLGFLGGCSTEPSATVAATLEISLATPFQDDGALLFTVTGGRVDSVEAVGYELYSTRLDPNTLRVIATGDLHSGTIARLHIGDERLIPQYSTRVDQVAARATYAQRDPASYSLKLRR